MSTSNDADRDLSAEELSAIEEKYDEASQTRQVSPSVGKVLKVVALVFALYHYLTAGFGLPADHWHMGWHLTGLFILTYALFPIFRTRSLLAMKVSALRVGNIPLYDLTFMIFWASWRRFMSALRGAAFPALGIEEQTFRMGNPNSYDIFFGVIIIVLVLDLARRTLGWVLPLIICVFISYALLGPWFPGILQHPGVKFNTFVSSMYFPQEGIFGVTLWVVSTIVFHFVLFGVIAQRTGLVPCSSTMRPSWRALYRRPGKGVGGVVGVFRDDFRLFGGQYGVHRRADHPQYETAWISGALCRRRRGGCICGRADHPADHGGGRLHHGGVPGASLHDHRDRGDLSGAVALCRACSRSCTLMARKLDLKGMSKDMLPQFAEVWRDGWANIIPLVGLLIVLFSGYTPFMSAFCGISLSVIVGMARYRAPVTLVLPAACSSLSCCGSIRTAALIW